MFIEIKQSTTTTIYLQVEARAPNRLSLLRENFAAA